MKARGVSPYLPVVVIFDIGINCSSYTRIIEHA